VSGSKTIEGMGPGGPAAGPTILIVEDDDETRRALVRELIARRYRIDEARDGRTAGFGRAI